MKINFSSLFQTPLEKYRHFFVFGNDPLVFERINSFLQQKLSLLCQTKTEGELLASSVSQPSLFDSPTKSSLTFVPHVTDKILKKIDALNEGIFIFTSEKARAQSQIVTYFAQSPISLAIAAYASPLIPLEFEFLVKGMSLPSPLKDLLFKAYQNDYMGLLSAIKKLKLYGEVEEKDYASFLSSSLMSDELTPLIHAFLLKDIKRALSSFSGLSSLEVIPFLRTLASSFQALFELIPFKKSSQTIPWQKLTSRIFFKDQPIYEAALLRWHSKEVQTLLETFLVLERKAKSPTFVFSQAKQDLLSFLK